MHDDWAVCFLNRSLKMQKIEFDWSKNIIKDDFAKSVLNADKDTCKIRDLWSKKNIGKTKNILQSELAGHDVLMLKLIK